MSSVNLNSQKSSSTDLVVIDETKKLGTLGKISFVRKKQMNLEYTLGFTGFRIDPNISRMDQKMINLLDQMLQMDGNENSEETLQFRTMIEGAFGQIETQIKNKNQLMLQEANVSSLDELRKKGKTISSLEDQAKQLFLQSEENIQLACQTDQNLLLLANKGTPYAKDQRTVQNFWELVRKSSDGNQIFSRYEEDSASAFGDTMIDSCLSIFASLDQMKMESNFSPLNHMKSMLSKIDQMGRDKIEELIGKRKNPKISKEEAIQLDYLILQCRIKGPACMNVLKRMLIKPQLEMQEQMFISSVEDSKETINNMITSREKSISKKTELAKKQPILLARIQKDIESDRKFIEHQAARDLYKEVFEQMEMERWHNLKSPETAAEEVISSLFFGNNFQEQLEGSVSSQLSLVEPEMRLSTDQLSTDLFIGKMKEEALRKHETISKALSSDQIEMLE